MFDIPNLALVNDFLSSLFLFYDNIPSLVLQSEW